MNPIQFVNEIAFTFLEGIVIMLLFLFIVNKKTFIKRKKLESFVFLVSYTVFSYFCTTYTPPGLRTLFHVLFIVILLCFLTKLNLYACTIAFVAIGLFMSFVEVITLGILMLAFNVEIPTLAGNPEFKLLGLLITKSIFILVIVLLYKSKIRIPNFSLFNNENSFAFTLLQIFTISIFVVSISNMSTTQHNPLLFNIFILMIYVLSILLGILDYKDRSKLLKLHYKLQAYEEYVKNMEGVIDLIRKEKHDFCNHLNTILAICKLNKPDAVQKLEAYVGKLSNTLTSPHHHYDSGNDYINGFLSVKSTLALDNHIDLDADFEAGLDLADVEDNDLISILGNILDNAVEAIKSESGRSESYISILTYTKDDSYILSISNNGPEIPAKVLERIFDSGFTTKSNTRGDRGYGLHIVQYLVKKNVGEISVSSSKEAGTEFIIRFKLKKRLHRSKSISP